MFVVGSKIDFMYKKATTGEVKSYSVIVTEDHADRFVAYLDNGDGDINPNKRVFLKSNIR